jgi:hypothetical protein
MLIIFMAAVQLSWATPGANRPLLNFKAPPAISFTVNEFVDFTLPIEIPCANDVVELTGQLHFLFHITINGNNIIVKTHAQPQGISGIGTSGQKYQGTGVTQDISKGSLVNGQFTFTAVNNFRIIGQGPGNNYLVHDLLHVTINANGEVTVVIDRSSFECK